MANHKASCIFCDDIRHEIGEKVSLMGCYTKFLVTPFMPIMMPKICAHTTINTDPTEELREVHIKLIYNGKEMASSSFEAREAQELIDNAGSASINISSGITVPNILIDKEGDIELIVVINGETQIAGTLKIIKSEPAPATKK